MRQSGPRAAGQPQQEVARAQLLLSPILTTLQHPVGEPMRCAHGQILDLIGQINDILPEI
jgi:hypothetical protein